jgi:hypothetical protein
VGIHRINCLFIEEFNSPGDLRFRIETDIRLPDNKEGRGLARRLRKAIESSHHERVRNLLLDRLERPVLKGDRVTAADLIRVRRLVTGALSAPRKDLPPESAPRRKKRR